MPHFGRASKDRRDQCHPKLQRVLDEAIKHYDLSCIWGYRDRETQNGMFENGQSLLMFPDSKHNRKPSRAFDVIPYPEGFAASDATFYLQATYIYRAANTCGVRIVWGGHWTKLKDLAHFELDNKEV